jgi:hypothetical protein
MPTWQNDCMIICINLVAICFLHLMCYRNTANKAAVLGACSLELKDNYTQKYKCLRFFPDLKKGSLDVVKALLWSQNIQLCFSILKNVF